MTSNLISSNGDTSMRVSHDRERSRCNIYWARHYRDVDYIALSFPRSRGDIKISPRRRERCTSIKMQITAAASEDRFSNFSSRITVRFPVDGRTHIGDDRSRSRWHSAQWLFLPLLEKLFVSAYGFTALWFYHLWIPPAAICSTILLSQFPLCLPHSRTLSICLGLPFSLSHPSTPSSYETLRNYCPMKLDVIHVPDVHDSFTGRTTSNAVTHRTCEPNTNGHRLFYERPNFWYSGYKRA